MSDVGRDRVEPFDRAIEAAEACLKREMGPGPFADVDLAVFDNAVEAAVDVVLATERAMRAQSDRDATTLRTLVQRANATADEARAARERAERERDEALASVAGLRGALLAHVEQFGGVHCHPEDCPDVENCDEYQTAKMVDAALSSTSALSAAFVARVRRETRIADAEAMEAEAFPSINAALRIAADWLRARADAEGRAT